MELPAALATALAPLRRCDALGANGRTWRIERDDGPWLIKRMSSSRSPEAVTEVLAGLSTTEPARAPALVQAVWPPDEDGWYGRFTWLDGHPRRAEDPGWPVAWAQALELLAMLHDTAPPTSGLPPLTEQWVARLAAMDHLDAIAALLRRQLLDDLPGGSLGLAHGDFGLQNLVWIGGEPALVDWEELGLAPAEFDGGWLLTMSAVGATPSLATDALRSRLTGMGLEPDRLRWYQGLGLLRLSWRMRALSLPPSRAGAMAQRVRAAMVELLR
jgi:aminoglycoside phosphotransferase (APT) family kinase protein